MITGTLNLKMEKQKHKIQTKQRSFKKFDKEIFMNDLSKYPWHDLLLQDDINYQVELVNSFMIDNLNSHAPWKNISKCKNMKKAPWITSELVDLIKQKKMSFLRALENGGHYWKLYRKEKNELNHRLRAAKKTYYKNIFIRNKSKPKDLWKHLNKLTGKNQHRNTEMECSPEDLNNHFVTMGDQIQSKLLKGRMTKIKYIDDEDRVDEDTEEENEDGDLFELETINKKTLNDTVEGLSDNSAVGFDGWGNKILKLAMPILEDFLLMIMNNSILSNRVPKMWKKGIVTPIFKSGDKSDPNNYRPITVLPAAGKVLEKLVAAQITKYLEDNNLISTSQSGFRKNHSVSTLLVGMLDDFYKDIEEGKIIGVVTIDIRKAFDCVTHNILLSKMTNKRFGINTILWMQDFLSGRSQATKLNNNVSTFSEVRYGVPQGSALSPILFSIFIDDLPEVLSFCKATMFADDLTIYCSGLNVGEMMANIHHDLNRILGWMQLNNLQINDSKTNFMIIGTRKRKSNLKCNEVILEFDNLNIPQSKNLKILGVYIDEHLIWDSHINYLYNSAMKTLYYLFKLKKTLNMESLNLLYMALIQSKLDYCCVVYNSAGITLTNKLQKIQNRAARLLVFGKGPSSATMALHKLQWSTLELRRKFFILVIMWKISNGVAPNYLSMKFKLVKNVHNYGTRQSNNFFINQNLSSLKARSFVHIGSKLWNDLPLSIRQLDLIGFKRELKKVKKN